MQTKPLKYPVSALVVLHDGERVLLIKRTNPQNFWQSVTGSIEPQDQDITATALREVAEETGIHLNPEQLDNWHDSTVYEIYHHWRHRYPPGVFENREHLFSAQIPPDTPVILNPEEHTAYQWLPFTQAAETVFSPSNRRAILELQKRLQTPKQAV